MSERQSSPAMNKNCWCGVAAAVLLIVNITVAATGHPKPAAQLLIQLAAVGIAALVIAVLCVRYWGQGFMAAPATPGEGQLCVVTLANGDRSVGVLFSVTIAGAPWLAFTPRQRVGGCCTGPPYFMNAAFVQGFRRLSLEQIARLDAGETLKDIFCERQSSD